MYASESQVAWLDQTNSLTNNTAKEGGGALYFSDSEIFLCRSLIFDHNVAKKGGAIFVDDLYCAVTPSSKCPLCFVTRPCSLHFENNTALQGLSVYGGLLGY